MLIECSSSSRRIRSNRNPVLPGARASPSHPPEWRSHASRPKTPRLPGRHPRAARHPQCPNAQAEADDSKPTRRSEATDPVSASGRSGRDRPRPIFISDSRTSDSVELDLVEVVETLIDAVLGFCATAVAAQLTHEVGWSDVLDGHSLLQTSRHFGIRSPCEAPVSLSWSSSHQATPFNWNFAVTPRERPLYAPVPSPAIAVVTDSSGRVTATGRSSALADARNAFWLRPL